eukprot:6191351-Pleurochrysis_carterae.AAC.1
MSRIKMRSSMRHHPLIAESIIYLIHKRVRRLPCVRRLKFRHKYMGHAICELSVCSSHDAAKGMERAGVVYPYTSSTKSAVSSFAILPEATCSCDVKVCSHGIAQSALGGDDKSCSDEMCPCLYEGPQSAKHENVWRGRGGVLSSAVQTQSQSYFSADKTYSQCPAGSDNMRLLTPA